MKRQQFLETSGFYLRGDIIRKLCRRSLRAGRIDKGEDPVKSNLPEKFQSPGEGRTRTGKMVFFPWEDGILGQLISVRIERVTDLSLYSYFPDGK